MNPPSPQTATTFCCGSTILQAIVLGDARSYLTALIIPNWELLAKESESRGNGIESRDGLRRHPDVIAMIERVIADRLRDLAPYEQVRRFTLLDRPFTIEAGELTPKLSLRRKSIESNFASEIETMYSQSMKPNIQADPQ